MKEEKKTLSKIQTSPGGDSQGTSQSQAQSRPEELAGAAQSVAPSPSLLLQHTIFISIPHGTARSRVRMNRPPSFLQVPNNAKHISEKKLSPYVQQAFGSSAGGFIAQFHLQTPDGRLPLFSAAHLDL